MILAGIFTLFYRFGVRIPLRPFFTVTSALLYYMAFVFAGKAVRELQEGGALPVTLLSGFPHIDAMGIFPSVETLLAQLILLLLLAFALIKTFWPRRSVTLPTVAVTSPSDAAPGVSTASPSRADALERRVAELEARLSDVTTGARRDRGRKEAGRQGLGRRTTSPLQRRATDRVAPSRIRSCSHPHREKGGLTAAPTTPLAAPARQKSPVPSVPGSSGPPSTAPPPIQMRPRWLARS